MRDLVTFVMKLLEFILITLQITTTICRRKQPKEEEELTSSEESIENLLYYRDCKHKPKEVSTEAPKAAPVVVQRLREPECPCPRMCCSMCCECGGMGMNGGMGMSGGKSMFARVPPNNMVMGGPNGMNSMSGMGGMGGMGGGMGGTDNIDDMMEPMGMPPSPPHQPPSAIQPPILRAKKKKKMLPMNMDMSMLPPIGARRGAGFTREHIKNLIAQDDDIKKILKDLVKVTMSKVDLVDGVPAPQPLPRGARVQRRSGVPNNGEDEDDD